MHKNFMITMVSGLLLVQSTTMAAVLGSGGVSAAPAVAVRPMVSVMSDLDRRLAAVYPQTYKFHDRLNLPEDIRNIQHKMNLQGNNFPIRTNADQADLGRLVEWYADLGLQYLCLLGDSPHKIGFMAELERIKTAPFADANRYVNVYTVARALALASEGAGVSPEMRDIFEKLPSKLLFAMHETIGGTPAWQRSALEVAVLADDDATPSKKRVSKSKIGLSKLAHTLFKEEKRKQFPKKMYVSVPGTDKFGLTMLVRSWLEAIYPIAMPTEAKKAHGSTLPPDYFSHHDRIHSENDDRRDAALRWARKVLSDASVNRTYNYKQAVPDVIQMAKHRFDLLNLMFTKLLDHAAETCATNLEIATTNAEKKAAKQAYNQTLAAVFYILHETPGAFDEGLFNQKTPEEMLSYVVQHAIGEARESTDEDKTPTFVNFSGERVKDDAAIKAWVFESGKNRVPDYFGQSYSDVEITSSPAFTNIRVTTNGGSEQKVPVMHKSVQLMLLEDDATLLKLVGIEVPALAGELGTPAYEASAQGRVGGIQDGLQTLLLGLSTKYADDVRDPLAAHPLVAAVFADNVKLATYGYTFGMDASERERARTTLLDLHRAQATVPGPMGETSLQYLLMQSTDAAQRERARTSLMDLHRARAFVSGPSQEASLQYLVMNGNN